MNEFYYLMQNRNNRSNELHIFAGESDISICKKLNIKDATDIQDSDKIVDENEMRELCCEKGRQVCGTCVSSLYGNFSQQL